MILFNADKKIVHNVEWISPDRDGISVDFLTDTPLDLVSRVIDHARREDVRLFSSTGAGKVAG
ncbi:MAG: hypothetical protein ABIO76_03175 [Ginsengibacter sp.]